ncbi:MAG: MBL fold metallo-hydrolase [Pseudomonadota bacterium]
MVKVSFLGSGDAFGHGGRMQACIMVEALGRRMLLDCGASALISLRRAGVEPNSIEFIALSHLHADHYGGLPFFILDAQLFSKRRDDLFLAGPLGLAQRLPQALEVMFPGSATVRRPFEVPVRELAPGQSWSAGPFHLRAAAATHPPGDPRLCYRLECGGKVIAYTGDTGWTPQLIPLAQGADLLIAEAYFRHKLVRDHLSYAEVLANLPALGAARVVLTHPGPDMLENPEDLELPLARDGLELEL